MTSSSSNTQKPIRNHRGKSPDSAQSVIALQKLAVLAEIVPDLARALGPDHEVVVHDLSRIPNSIIAIGGDITGRLIGGSITDLLLRAVRHGKTDSIFRYRSRTSDGRTLSSSTVFVREPDGTAIGCLCVNRDITDLLEMGALSERLALIVDSGDTSERPGGADDETSPEEETLVPTVDDLALVLVNQAIEHVGVPVELMQKRHKAQVIQELEAGGLFMLRESIDFVARTLRISRESVYNYLKEVRGDSSATSGSAVRRGLGQPRIEASRVQGSEEVE